MDNIIGIKLSGLSELTVALFIFFARIVDVSIGTMRIVVVSRDMRTYAALLGFFEVFIWLVAISQVLQNLNGWISYFAYSAGFAAGTFVGMSIERRLRLGTSIIRIVAPRDAEVLADEMTKRGHRVTTLEGKGAKGPVLVIFSIVQRKLLKDVLSMVKSLRPDAFYSVEDVRLAREFEGIHPSTFKQWRLLQPFYWFRKGK